MKRLGGCRDDGDDCETRGLARSAQALVDVSLQRSLAQSRNVGSNDPMVKQLAKNEAEVGGLRSGDEMGL